MHKHLYIFFNICEALPFLSMEVNSIQHNGELNVFCVIFVTIELKESVGGRAAVSLVVHWCKGTVNERFTDPEMMLRVTLSHRNNYCSIYRTMSPPRLTGALRSFSSVSRKENTEQLWDLKVS